MRQIQAIDSEENQFECQQSLEYKGQAHVLKVVLNISLASTYTGFVLVYFNTINFDDTVSIFEIKQDRALMQGLLSFCIFIGAAVGGYLSSYMLSLLSRKQCFLYTGYVSIIATLLLQTKVIEVVFVCRLVQGVSVGLTSVFRSLYIKEFVPIELAAKMGSINQLMLSIGLIFTFVQTYVLSLFLQPETYWRIVYVTPVVFLAVQVVNLRLRFPYETPKYLLEQGRREEACILIRQIYTAEKVQKRIVELQKIIEMARSLPITDESAERDDVASEVVKSGKGKSNKIAICAAIHLSALQQTTGIQIVVLYTGEMLLSILPSMEKIVPIFLSTLGFAMTFYGMKLLQSYGRKEMIQRGLLGMAVIHSTICLAYLWKNSQSNTEDDTLWMPSVIIIIGLLSMRALFSLTIGPIVWIYLPEIVEGHIVSIATMVNGFTAAFLSFIFPIFVRMFGGPAFIFGVIALLILIGYGLNEHLLVQTKDRPQWEVRSEYDNKLTQ